MQRRKTLFVHAGDDCAPTLICDEHLEQRVKLPFMLGVFPLKSIIEILKSRFTPFWTEIEDLVCDGELRNPYRIREAGPNDTEISCHGHSHAVTNKRWNLLLNHDFIVDGDEILNYPFVQRVTAEKIKNFTDALNLRGERWQELSQIVLVNITYLDSITAHAFGEDTLDEYVKLAKELREAALDFRETNQENKAGLPEVRVVCLLIPMVAGSLRAHKSIASDGGVVVSVLPHLCHERWWTLPREEKRHKLASLIAEFNTCLTHLGGHTI